MLIKLKIPRIALLITVLIVRGYDLSSMNSSQSGWLSVRVLDVENREEIPVRVKLTDMAGNVAPLPDAAIGVMYGRDDRAEGYAFQPDSSFYVDGSFSVELIPGSYHLKISKGFEYITQERTINIKEGERISLEITLERWIDMPYRGWYSADDHIHIRRSPRENPMILKWIAAEDIHIGALLQMGDFWTTYYAQYTWGKEGVYQVEDRLLSSGQEDPRTHEIGHTILLAHDSAVRHKHDYYSYDHVFDRVHELNGLTGYAHQGMSFHGYRGMTMDVLQKKIDFLELLQFCVPDGPLHLEHYYHFLDLGYKLTATAGSDFPWCGRSTGWDARIGNARFYTHMGDSISFESWKENLKAGHTFVSSGPMLDLKVNGMIPGNEYKAKEGDILTITASAFGQEEMIPLESLEIVVHGKVIATRSASAPGQSREQIMIDMELPVSGGIWIAARCRAGEQQVAHTTPVYVTVGKDGFINRETAPRYLDISEQYLQEIEEEIAEKDDRMDYHAWRYREELQDRIAKTRLIIEELRDRIE